MLKHMACCAEGNILNRCQTKMNWTRVWYCYFGGKSYGIFWGRGLVHGL